MKSQEIKSKTPVFDKYLKRYYTPNKTILPVRLPLKEINVLTDSENTHGATTVIKLSNPTTGQKVNQAFVLLPSSGDVETTAHEMGHVVLEHYKEKIKKSQSPLERFIIHEVDAWIWAEGYLGKNLNILGKWKF